MDLALDVDSFAGRKCSIEIGGILEFELGRTHSMLPSSVLSESGSRGRSLADPLSYRSEEHTSELQSHSFISYAVFCLKKKINKICTEAEGQSTRSLRSTRHCVMS